ncbi:MAG: hypothetical protein Kow0090_20860 [Myxococcota bacterium]
MNDCVGCITHELLIGVSVEFYRSLQVKALSVQNIGKTFYPSTWLPWRDKSSRLAVEALKGVSIEVNTGERVGLIGPNGSGKTTLIKIISGLILPDTGSVELFERDISSYSELSHVIGMALGDRRSFFLPVSARENLRFFGLMLGIESRAVDREIERAAEWAGISDALDRKTSTFSQGMITRLALARSFLLSPPIFLLDEPTASLDYRMTARLARKVEELSQNGAAILITSHDLALIADWCSRVYLIEKGEIIRCLRGDEVVSEISQLRESAAINRINKGNDA